MAPSLATVVWRACRAVPGSTGQSNLNIDKVCGCDNVRGHPTGRRDYAMGDGGAMSSSVRKSHGKTGRYKPWMQKSYDRHTKYDPHESTKST